MTKKALTREQKVFKELAATGKYVSTGKVLIGLTSPSASHPEMTQRRGAYAEHLCLATTVAWSATGPWCA
jgi:hypothetical protein